MLRRILPRRLNHEEEATLVEHLSELRHRLFIGILALSPGLRDRLRRSTSEIIEKLMELLPEGTQLVTLGVTEPFFTSLKVSFYVGIAIALPVLLWQVWAFLAPAVSRGTQRVLGVFVVIATAAVLHRRRLLLPDHPPRARSTSSSATTTSSTHEQVRASYFLSFVTLTLLATGLAFEMPIFILALVRLGVLSSATLRRNRRIGYVVDVRRSRSCCPRSTPSRSPSRCVPLLSLFELSIWLSVHHGAPLGARVRRVVRGLLRCG